MSVKHFTDWRDLYGLEMFCEVDFWINSLSLESIREALLTELREQGINVSDEEIVNKAIEMRIDELNTFHDLPWAEESLKADIVKMGYPVTQVAHLDWCFSQEWYFDFISEMLKSHSVDELAEGLSSGEITFDTAHGNLCGFSACEIKASLIRNIAGEAQ